MATSSSIEPKAAIANIPVLVGMRCGAHFICRRHRSDVDSDTIHQNYAPHKNTNSWRPVIHANTIYYSKQPTKSNMTDSSKIRFTGKPIDLDAAAGNDPEVVFELGTDGRVTQLPTSQDVSDDDSTMKEAEDFKQKGNEAFKEQNWDLALEMYTAAIEATPGPKGQDLLLERDAYELEQQKSMRRKYAEEEEEKRKAKQQSKEQAKVDGSTDPVATAEPTSEPPEPPKPFQPTPHIHGDKLAVYHCNRAAVYLHLLKYDQAISDCDIAILWKPNYTKAFMRRSCAHEHLDATDKALDDAKAALETDPRNAKLQASVKRLSKIEDERLEKLKEETMGKLKDLGNSILGNFGLSLNNFKTVQDPNTGSYSISFDQNN
jgi:tetratricopeptide (TPR) repeat protein